MRYVVLLICFYLPAVDLWGQAPVAISADSLNQFLSQHPAKDTLRVKALNQLAFLNYYSNPVNSLSSAFESRQISDSLSYTKGEAEALRQIGLAFWAQADMTTAINYFLMGLRLAEANHHTQIEADITGNIGTAYNGLNNPNEALSFLTKARQMQQSLNNKWREASVLNNIGDSYLALHEFDEAANAYTIALNYSIKENYKLGISTNFRNLGNVLETKGDLDSALTVYFKCVSLSSEIKDNRGYILSHKSIASIYFKKKQFSLSKKYIQIALDAAVRGKLRAFIRDSYELLYKIAEAESDKRKSYDYFKLYTAYKDSVQNIRVVSEVATQRLRFETEKKQTEIELLKGDAELKTERLKNKNSQLYFSIGISILSFLLLGLVAHNFWKTKERNRLLSKKNDEIFRQHLKISEQRDELISLNEEIRSQQEEVMAQHDALVEKNEEIEAINKKIIEINENLEKLVAQRTQVLESQNKKLSEYAFLNSHKLRAPLASILGLVTLIKKKPLVQDDSLLIQHLEKSAQELDHVVKGITTMLHQESDSKN